MNRICACIMALALAGCLGDDDETQHTISSGLKIFVTPELHAFNFVDDPTLSGATGIQKADDFCNRSSGKPNSSTYRALLIDDTNRDATTDWVLQPNTTYYQVYDDVVIDTTTNAAIFNAFFTPMRNPVCGPRQCTGNAVWTGIGSAADFSPSDNDCGDWGSAGSSGSDPNCGVPTVASGDAFSNCFAYCGSANGSQPLHLYCVEQ